MHPTDPVREKTFFTLSSPKQTLLRLIVCGVSGYFAHYVVTRSRLSYWFKAHYIPSSVVSFATALTTTGLSYKIFPSSKPENSPRTPPPSTDPALSDSGQTIPSSKTSPAQPTAHSPTSPQEISKISGDSPPSSPPKTHTTPVNSGSSSSGSDSPSNSSGSSSSSPSSNSPPAPASPRSSSENPQGDKDPAKAQQEFEQHMKIARRQSILIYLQKEFFADITNVLHGKDVAQSLERLREKITENETAIQEERLSTEEVQQALIAANTEAETGAQDTHSASSSSSSSSNIQELLAILQTSLFYVNSLKEGQDWAARYEGELEQQKKASLVLIEKLKGTGEIFDPPDDGKCLFASLSHSLKKLNLQNETNENLSPFSLRKRVAQELKRLAGTNGQTGATWKERIQLTLTTAVYDDRGLEGYPEPLKGTLSSLKTQEEALFQFIYSEEKEKGWNSYCDHLQNEKMFGGEVELQVIANLFQLNIHLYQEYEELLRDSDLVPSPQRTIHPETPSNRSIYLIFYRYRSHYGAYYPKPPSASQ